MGCRHGVAAVRHSPLPHEAFPCDVSGSGEWLNSAPLTIKALAALLLGKM